jgi:hypothetical protein
MAYFEYRPTQTLFQYTSADGLSGILKSKHLWFCDLRAANDPRELHLGHDSVTQALNSLLQSDLRASNRQKLSQLVEYLTGYFDRVQIFCACLSLAEDELPMWGAYGQTYSGLAIGFRPAAVAGMPVRVQRVRYLDPSKANEEFNAIAEAIAGRLDDRQPTADFLPMVGAAAAVAATATALKHRSWAYENEIRLIYSQPRQQPTGRAANLPSSKLPGGDYIYWREPLERKVGTRSVPYVQFPYGRLRDGKFDPARAIKTVIVGPNCSLSILDVEDELSRQGFQDWTVQKSNCHIRL